MDEVLKIDTIAGYDALIGAETLHPLVNVVDFSSLPPIRFINARKLYGFYAVFLKGSKFSALSYGRSSYDYQEDTLVFVAPGQIMGSLPDGEYHQLKGHVLMFHPDFLKDTLLAGEMKQYTFFSYNVNEALHLSASEKKTVLRIMQSIHDELRDCDDRTSSLVVDYIKLFLDYCVRFYDRQFHDRHPANHDLLERFESVMDGYLRSGQAQTHGLLSVQYCADKLCLSSNYLSDLIKRETGISALKHIHRKTLEVAKEKVCDTSKSISEIAYELGFPYPQHFGRWFKKMTGCTPNEYRIG